MKSVRVAAARERGRRKFASSEPLTQPYTRQLPGWLRWNDDTKKIEAIPERAAVVKKIFKLADKGVGQHSIAGWLNENAGEPWGRGKRKGARWHRSYVRKILTNPAVVGTFTPHTAQRDPETRKLIWTQPTQSAIYISRRHFPIGHLRTIVAAPRSSRALSAHKRAPLIMHLPRSRERHARG